jgi:hypothetical protein
MRRRLAYDLPRPVALAHDGRGNVLLSGLGALGVGQAWVPNNGRYNVAALRRIERAPDA